MIDVRSVDVIADSLRAMLLDVPLREDTIEDYAEHIDRDLADMSAALQAWTLLRDAMELLPTELRPIVEAMTDEITADYRRPE